jgi:uncharacterized protein (TIGR00269 family)
MTERETAANALLRGIDYVEEECPNAAGARSILYKNALNQIEAQSPGTKYNFVVGFLERVRALMDEAQEEFEFRDCAICGQSTTSEVCAFCRMWQQAHQKAQEQRTGSKPAKSARSTSRRSSYARYRHPMKGSAGRPRSQVKSIPLCPRGNEDSNR